MSYRKIDFIKPSGEIKESIKSGELTKNIVEKLSVIEDISQFKENINLTSLVVNIVENSIKNRTKMGFKKNKPVDKKEIVINIMSQLFEDPSEGFKERIGSQIEYLHSNHLIKKVSMLVISAYYIYDWVARRIL